MLGFKEEGVVAVFVCNKVDKIDEESCLLKEGEMISSLLRKGVETNIFALKLEGVGVLEGSNVSSMSPNDS